MGRVVILVKDYDTAFGFYEKNFFCKKLYDETTPNGQRFLHIKFPQDDGLGIWFLKSESDEQKLAVGKQTAGQPTIVLYTDEIESLYTHLKRNDVRIIEDLTITEESKFFHCLDLYDNRITVVQLMEKFTNNQSA